jgi:hypothetical protein
MSPCTQKGKRMSKVKEWLEKLAGLLAPKARIVESTATGDDQTGIVTVALIQGDARIEMAVSYDRQNFRVGFSVKKAEGYPVSSGSVTFENNWYEVHLENILEMKFKSASMIPWGIIGAEIEKAIR